MTGLLDVLKDVDLVDCPPKEKLDYYREGQSEKHLNDIRDILMNIKIDENYIQTWVEKLGLKTEWKKI